MLNVKSYCSINMYNNEEIIKKPQLDCSRGIVLTLKVSWTKILFIIAYFAIGLLTLFMCTNIYISVTNSTKLRDSGGDMVMPKKLLPVSGKIWLTLNYSFQ